MDLVPVPRSKVADMRSSRDREFVVPLERQQQIGVTFAEARKRPMRHEVRTVGTLEVDPAGVFECVAGVDGYIAELRVDSPGEHVSAGEPLLVIHSPDLQAPEQDLINLLKVYESGTAAPASMDHIMDLAHRRLRLLNVDQQEIAELERTRQSTDYLVIRSAIAGIVSDAPMKIGMSVKRGDELVKVVNLSHLRLWANFYEDEIALLKEGDAVTVSTPAFPGQSFDGKVVAIGPTIDPLRRTGSVRIDIPNSSGLLRPGMFADVVAKIEAGEGITIPADSVVPLGSRMLVFVDRGFGKLQPRLIQVGRQFTDPDASSVERYYQVLGGLKEGERIVASANFLIDAEAQIQGVLRDFGEEPSEVSVR
ncbi:MAG: efflux RND transporter periplasmic adaptor subunit [Verrucomicrobia bacterium]|nr:efflux RND transporter periplasmic adaptor subunit [Verrucomicrobiota bacterium]